MDGPRKALTLGASKGERVDVPVCPDCRFLEGGCEYITWEAQLLALLMLFIS
jgi:hypothetical protein